MLVFKQLFTFSKASCSIVILHLKLERVKTWGQCYKHFVCVTYGPSKVSWGQGKPIARISTNINGLSATSPPAGTTLT